MAGDNDKDALTQKVTPQLSEGPHAQKDQAREVTERDREETRGNGLQDEGRQAAVRRSGETFSDLFGVALESKIAADYPLDTGRLAP